MSAFPAINSMMVLDRLVHEPARLLILSILAGAESVEFGFVEQLSGLSKGNLSSHLGKLETVGLIEIVKSFRGKRPLTTLKISASGRLALAEYRQRLASVVAEIPQSPHSDA